MNREVAILREVIVKVTQLLVGKGLRVTQQGAQAFVEPDRDGKPVRINIPYLADDASPGMIIAIQGFIDHEVGHVLFTEFSYKQKERQANPRLHQLHNVIEDPMIEKLVGEKFPGANFNLGLLHEFYLEKVTEPALAKAKTEEEQFSYLIVAVMRALSGPKQRVYHDWLTKHGYWDHKLVKALLKGMGEELIASLPKCRTSRDTFVIAERVHDILHPPAPPAPPAPPPPPVPPEDSEDEEGDKSESDEKSDSDTGEGSNTDKPEDEDDKGSGGESDETPESDEGEDDAPASDEKDEGDEPESDESDDEPESDESDDEPDDDGEGEPDDSESGGKGEAPEPDSDDEAGDQDDPKSDESDEGDASDQDKGDEEDGESVGHESEEDGDEAGDEPGDGGSDKNDGESAGGDEDGEPETPAKAEADPGKGSSAPEFQEIEVDISGEFDTSISEVITDEATTSARSSDYRVFTRDQDVIEPFKVNEARYSDRWLRDMDDKVSHMVGGMQKEIERMMAARSQVLNIPGFRSGRLHAASLHRLHVGDDRVFRRRHEAKSKDTAVTLLVDNSGSMSGDKQELAMLTAYALSQTLERVGITHEVIGFTTLNVGDREYLEELEKEQKRIGESFSRIEPIYMPIYKGFDERLTPQIKQRFAQAYGRHDFLRNNIDGECLEIAASRIAPRKEHRKVIIVISDGSPACYTDHSDEIENSLHRAVKNLNAAKIETIGIGILDRSVKRFYPKHVVLNDISKLPGEVMGQLKTILMA